MLCCRSWFAAHWFLCFAASTSRRLFTSSGRAAWSWVRRWFSRGQSHAVRLFDTAPWSSRCGIRIPWAADRGGDVFVFPARTRVAMPTPWRPAVGMLLICVLLVTAGRAISRVALPDLGDDCGGNRDLFRSVCRNGLAFGCERETFKPPAARCWDWRWRENSAERQADEACVLVGRTPIGASSGRKH